MTHENYLNTLSLLYVDEVFPEDNELLEMINKHGVFIPVTPHNDLNNIAVGEIRQFNTVAKRDLKFHAAYFKLCRFAYDFMPTKFKQDLPNPSKFYIWLKIVQKKYKTLYIFKEHPPMLEYVSIKFGRMNQLEFEDFIKEQIIYFQTMYERIYSKEKADLIISKIDEEFHIFYNKLFADKSEKIQKQ